MTDIDRIREWARSAQSMILERHKRDPEHSTFSQIGLLDGAGTVEDYLNHSEIGCAVHHLLYMVHESDIPYPAEDVIALHRLAEKIGEKNHYTRANQDAIPDKYQKFGFNIPK